MSDDVYERLNMLEVTQARHDEKIKSLEEVARDVKSMRIQLAVIVAGITLGSQLFFHWWK